MRAPFRLPPSRQRPYASPLAVPSVESSGVAVLKYAPSHPPASCSRLRPTSARARLRSKYRTSRVADEPRDLAVLDVQEARDLRRRDLHSAWIAAPAVAEQHEDAFAVDLVLLDFHRRGSPSMRAAICARSPPCRPPRRTAKRKERGVAEVLDLRVRPGSRIEQRDPVASQTGAASASGAVASQSRRRS